MAGKLQSQWSPEQIAEWLKRTYPGAKDLQVSHEAIYRTLFVQTRRALGLEVHPAINIKDGTNLGRRDNWLPCQRSFRICLRILGKLQVTSWPITWRTTLAADPCLPPAVSAQLHAQHRPDDHAVRA